MYISHAGLSRKPSTIRRPFYPVRVGLTILFLFLAPEVLAQPPMLGPADASAPPTRTPAGFMIYGRGFIGRFNHNRIRKSVGWLHKHDLTNDVPPFVLFGASISEHWYLLEQADASWERTKRRFIACGGMWERAARSTNPRLITIYIEDRPFAHPAWPGRKLGGLTDGRVIRAAIAHVNGLGTPSPWLVNFTQTLEWEQGNLLAIRAGYDWQVSGIEIGNTSPCGRE